MTRARLAISDLSFSRFLSHHGEMRSGVFEACAELSFEFFQRVCGNILAQNFALQSVDEFALNGVTPNHQRVRAHPAILMHGAPVLRPANPAAARNEHDVGATNAAFQKTGKEIAC
jgi:hypothetical protein